MAGAKVIESLRLDILEVGDQIVMQGDDFEAVSEVLVPGQRPLCSMIDEVADPDRPMLVQLVGTVLYTDFEHLSDPLDLGVLRYESGRLLYLRLGVGDVANPSLCDFAVVRGGRIIMKTKAFVPLNRGLQGDYPKR